MGVLSEVFVATHAEALERAAVLDSGAVPVSVPHIELTQVGPHELEALGEAAARQVRFGRGDLEVAEVDLAYESLHRLSPFMAEVLVELAGSDEEDAVRDVAVEWAETMDPVPAGDLVPVVRATAELAVTARDSGRDLYVWTREV